MANLIFQMPFDESKGSAKAYDYSATRADGAVTGAEFVPGKDGNAISFSDARTDRCEVSKEVLDLDGDFTLVASVRTKTAVTGTPKEYVWLLNFQGVDNYIEVSSPAGSEWQVHSLVREGSAFRVYVDGSLVAETECGDTLKGFALLQDWYGGDYGFGDLDDVRIYDAAMTLKEIEEVLAEEPRQIYTLDGVDFRTYGVYVSSSSGILDKPKIKTPESLSWDDYHGSIVDLENIYLDVRDITLTCFCKADSKGNFIRQVRAFEEQFLKKGTRRLMIEAHPTKPLVYEVYCSEAVTVSKTWSEGGMVGTFTLKLVEPEPVKMVLKHIRTSDTDKTCEITLRSAKFVNIFWGDGECDKDVAGSESAVTVRHDYSGDGEYYPVIAGCIDEIEEFDTNAIIVWDKI